MTSYENGYMDGYRQGYHDGVMAEKMKPTPEEELTDAEVLKIEKMLYEDGL